MKYLGIDFGEKRVGIAVSDEDGKIAFPYSVVLNDGSLKQKLKEIIEKERINAVVMGESMDFKNEPNKIMSKIEKFKEIIRNELKIDVSLEPEFLTSAQAEKITGKNDMIDASAAAIILQSFLDKKNSMI